MEGLGFNTYDAYKDSHASWLGEVPADWQVGPGRICVYENKNKNTGMKESTVLSLSYGRVIVKDEDKMTGLVPESYETYQIVQPGDIIIRGTDLQNDVTSLRTGLAKDHGIITSAYINLRPKPNAYAEFLHYLLHSYDVKKVFYGLGSGLRQNLSYVDFKYLTIPLPSLSEQRAIVALLDDKCAKIDGAVKIKEDQIALLRERRQIIIQDAVTRGLNPDVPMKDSGASWLGEVPADWQVGPGRICVYENKNKNTGMKESTVLSLSYGRVIVKDEDKMTGLVPESYETYQIVQPGDIIIRGTDLQNDVTSLRTGLAKDHGIITSAYINLRPKPNAYAEFLHYLLHSYDVKKVFYGLGSGLRQNLSYVDFKYLTIPLPSLTEQRAIVAFLDEESAKIDRGIDMIRREIAALKEYKTSLINAAITGKIKVI